jgi:GGDEF domain-containing protein
VKYSRFEWLALAVGGAAIVGTVLASLHGQPMVEEIVAQVLLLIVLAGAVHWGRGGGFLTAIVAIVAYIGMRAPLIVHDGLTPDLLTLILVRTAAYGVVGIVGGEVCGRIKYVLARLEGGTNLDEETHLYNQAYIARLLTANLGLHQRYRTPFSIALITLSPALTSELKPSRKRSMLRAVGNHVRNDVRLVDDVGRLSDGTFVLMLPQTPKTGGDVAASRVRASLRDLLGAKDESVVARVLGAPEDLTELNALRDSICEPAEDAAA